MLRERLNHAVRLCLLSVAVVAVTAAAHSTLRAQDHGDDDGEGGCHGSLHNPPVLTNIWPLSFGVLMASPSSGTAKIAATGSNGTYDASYYFELATSTGGVTVISHPEGAPGPAIFYVTGDDDATYSITLPTSTTMTSGSHSITVDHFKCNLGSQGHLSQHTGEQYFAIGGTAHIHANQLAAHYTGTFQVTVAYD